MVPSGICLKLTSSKLILFCSVQGHHFLCLHSSSEGNYLPIYLYNLACFGMNTVSSQGPAQCSAALLCSFRLLTLHCIPKLIIPVLPRLLHFSFPLWFSCIKMKFPMVFSKALHLKDKNYTWPFLEKKLRNKYDRDEILMSPLLNFLCFWFLIWFKASSSCHGSLALLLRLLWPSFHTRLQIMSIIHSYT